MIKKIDTDAKRIAELELDLEDQKRSRALYQSKASLLEKDVQTLDQKVVCFFHRRIAVRTKNQLTVYSRIKTLLSLCLSMAMALSLQMSSFVTLSKAQSEPHRN